MKNILLLLPITLFLISCGGGGGNSPAAAPPEDPVEKTFSGQALLGPLVDAAVDLYEVGTFGSPLCSTTTTNSEDIEQAGLIVFDETCVEAEELYLLVLTGGQDIDADDDGILDSSPTAVHGKLHGILTGEQLLAGGWTLNALTEAAYWRVAFLLSTETDKEIILRQLSKIARKLLREDINDDGIIDHTDLGFWSPRTLAHLYLGNASQLDTLVQAIHNGESIKEQATSLTRPINVAYDSNLPGTLSIAVNKQHAALCGPSAVEKFDVTDPENIISSTVEIVFPAGDPFYVLQTCFITDDGYLYYSNLDINAPGSINFAVYNLNSSSQLLTSQQLAPASDKYYVIAGIENGLLFVKGTNSLLIYDISDRGIPEFLSEISLSSYKDSYYLDDSRLFVTHFNGRLSVYDLSDPTQPYLTQELQLPETSVGILVNGNRAFVSLYNEAEDSSELITLDIKDITQVEVIGEAYPLGKGKVVQIDYENSVLTILNSVSINIGSFIKDAISALILDVSQPEAPLLVASRSNNHAYTGTIQQGLLYSVSSDKGNSLGITTLDKGTSQIVGQILPSDDLTGFAIKDNTAYLTSNYKGLLVVDITERSSPMIVSSITEFEGIEANAYLSGITVQDNLALVRQDGKNIYLFDVSNPQTPTQIGFINLPNSGADAATAKDNIAYFATASGLVIVDTTQPDNPITLGTLRLENLCYSGTIHYEDGLIYFLDECAGTFIIDVSNHLAPAVIGHYISSIDSQSPIDIAIEGTTAYLIQATSRPGTDIIDFNIDGFLEIIDISNPAEPFLLSSLHASGGLESLTLNDGLAYISDRDGAVNIVDILDPLLPKLLHTTPVPEEVYDITSDANYVYVFSRTGLNILPITAIILDVP